MNEDPISEQYANCDRQNEIKILHQMLDEQDMEIKRLHDLLVEQNRRKKMGPESIFSMIDGIPAYVYLQKSDYSIRYANKHFIENFGDYHKKPCYQAMHGYDHPCEPCPTFEVFKTQKPQNWLFHKPDGTIFRIYDYPYIDEDGTFLVLEMGVDVTEIRTLEDSRSMLFSNISHELRTPLTRLLGYTEMLSDGMFESEIERELLISNIHSNAITLNKTIGKMLELSRLEAKAHTDLSPVQLLKALDDFCEEQRYYLKNRAIQFDYKIEDNLPIVMADSELILKVLSNLIENACRFVPDDGQIELCATCQEDYLQIFVRDNGTGIAKSDIKSIFERHFQGTCVCNDDHHNGLGLHICKIIIELHGGRIWVDSIVGEGATFYFQIPIYKPLAVANDAQEPCLEKGTGLAERDF
jgi:signal transduction histidine kinase